MLFKKIDNFAEWAKNYPNMNKKDLVYFDSEWELNYQNWDEIYSSFKDFISSAHPLAWNKEAIEKLLYIIARDNEDEKLAEIVSEKPEILIKLAQEAVFSVEKDARWQLATRLHVLKDRDLAVKLLRVFAQDQDEYVRRRATFELEKLEKN